MIINWTKDNVKIIPCVNAGQVVGKITLLPGNNDVADELWNAARQLVKDEIDRGLIKEVAVEAKKVAKTVIDPETKKEVIKEEVVYSSKSLKQMDLNKAIETVEGTYNMDTLKKWEKKEGRDSVRATIKNQIEKVEKYGDSAKKKDGDK